MVHSAIAPLTFLGLGVLGAAFAFGVFDEGGQSRPLGRR